MKLNKGKQVTKFSSNAVYVDREQFQLWFPFLFVTSVDFEGAREVGIVDLGDEVMQGLPNGSGLSAISVEGKEFKWSKQLVLLRLFT